MFRSASVLFPRRFFLAIEAQTAFISYSREDSEFALRLAGDLKAAGAAVWLDQLDIEPGQRWARAVQDALNDCPRMLVILSVTSASSTNVDDEVSFALEEKKTVIPVLYRDCKIPFRLRPFQFVDFRSDYPSGVKALVRVLTMERPREHGPSDPKQFAPVALEEVEAGPRKEATQPEATNQIPDSVPQQELPENHVPSPAQRQPLVSKSATPLPLQQQVLGQEVKQQQEPVPQEPRGSHRRLYFITGAIAAFVLLLAVPTVIVLRHRANSGQPPTQSAPQSPAQVTQQVTALQPSPSAPSVGMPDPAATSKSPRASESKSLGAVPSTSAVQPSTKRRVTTPQPQSASRNQDIAALESQAKQLYAMKQYAAALPGSRKACDGGNLSACVQLGKMYQFGQGVGPDNAQALALYRTACDGGDLAGCDSLGLMYKHGQGVGTDDAQAVALYRKACDGGDLTACNNLGNEYDRGRGVTLDKAQAVALYRKACDGAVPVGCDNLGRMYEKGRGVALDAGRAVALSGSPATAGFLKAAHGWA